VDRDKLLTLLETEEDGNLTDLALIQARLARRIVCAARPARCPSEQEFLSTDPPIRIDAMESYIRGLLASDAAQKHRLLAQAARLAPEFSEPCFELGRMQWEDGSYRVAAEWLIRVSPRDMRWLEAHFLLGLSRYHTGDYAGALAAFELVSRALETGEVWNNIGVVQFRLGRNEALASLSKAIQSDPNETDYRFNAGYVLWRQGDLAGATEQFKEVLKLDPEDVEAQRLLQHCQAGDGPRKGDLGIEGLERLRENYERLATAR
jgi:tetratricopeptide (TPR) repeat protein